MSQFYQMLDELNAATESERTHLKERIWNAFGTEKAVFVLDMSRYSSTIYTRGVFHALKMVRTLRSTATPIIKQFRSEILEQKADNLLVIFDQPLEAVDAAVALNRTFDKVNRTTPELENIYIKVGIDFGKFLRIDEVGFFGLPINLASKLGEDLSERSELLISDTVFERIKAELKWPVEKIQFSVSGLELVAYKVLFEQTAGS
ncbi:MAG: hypothetical protein H8D61_02465 [Deltaproteobacteria bacterium]|nr:hypothetical protein [Deltaproteobacteria bacterium]